MPARLLAQEKKDKALLYYNAIWHSDESKVSIDSAIHFFENLSEKYLQKNDTVRAINALRSVSQGYYRKGSLFESELSVVETLKLLDDRPLDSISKKTQKVLHIHLGMLYRKVNDYDSAIKQYSFVLKFSETLNDSITALNNLANIFSDMGEYQEAVNILNQVHEKTKVLNDYRYRSRVIDNLGYNESKLRISGAFERMMYALKMRLEKGDQEGIFSSYRHLTYYYIDRHNETKASEYASKAYDISNTLKLPSFKLEALRLKALVDNNIQTREFVRLSDSMVKAKNISNNKYVNKKYNYEKQERIARETEIKLKDSELNEQAEKSKRKTYQGVAVLILLLTGFTIIKIVDKHKKDKVKQAYLKEVEFSKKVHDELANDVSDLMNYIENDIVIPNKKKSQLLDSIEDIYLRTRDISTETASIDLVHFQESLANLLLQHNKAGTKVVINDINTINWNKVQDHKKVIVYRCLQELMVNMKKHSKAKLVSIIFKQQNDKKEIRYVDDGIGFDVEVTKLNGLANVESRIKSIKGTFNFTTSEGNGLKATLMFNS